MSMIDLPEFASRAIELYENITNDAWPRGAKLTCSTCKRVTHVSNDECRHYLAHGWPKCCGFTMTLEAESATQTGRS